MTKDVAADKSSFVSSKAHCRIVSPSKAASSFICLAAMEKLPRELIDAVLEQCVALCTRNDILRARLVCRLFDRYLKPFACRTTNLEFSRLSRTSHLPPPRLDGLQTVGYHCRSIYIDLMVLRDDRKSAARFI